MTYKKTYPPDEEASVYTGPGRVEAHTHGVVSGQIPSASIVQNVYLDVWNNVENTHYGPIHLPIDPGNAHFEDPADAYFGLDYSHTYTGSTQTLTCTLHNWSATWGREMRLHITYEL